MRPSRLAIVFSLMSAFSSSFAIAQESCSALFASEYALQGRIEMEPSALATGGKAADFGKTLSEIDSLIAPLSIPQETRVHVGTAFKASSFNAENFQVYVGLRPDSMGKKHPKVHQIILAHEYGHAIFEVNLMKDLESYKELRRDALTLEQKLRETIGEAKAFAAKADVTFHNKEKKAEIEGLAMNKALEAKAMADKLTAFRRYWTIRSAFHELFADSIALIATRDPKAVSDLLKDRTKKIKEHSSEDIYLRDFTDGRHHLNRQRWDKEQILFSGLLGDVYYAFLPARWELWNISKNKIKSEKYRKELSYKVFSILERNLSEIFAKGPEELGPNGLKNMDKINQQLIEDFRREL